MWEVNFYGNHPVNAVAHRKRADSWNRNDCTRGGSLSFGEVPDLSGLPGIHVEVKRVERLNVQEAMEQSIRDCQQMGDGIPALFHRRNRKPWLVTMRLEDWLMIYGTNAFYQKLPKKGGVP